MIVRVLSSTADMQRFGDWLETQRVATLWQSEAWAQYQGSLGREVRIYAVESEGRHMQASALVVIDKTAGGLCTWEIPRGPLGNDPEALSILLNTLVSNAKAERCIGLYMSPPFALKAQNSKLKASSRHIQPEATRMIDLSKTDEEILAEMHPKGRYNIGVARKAGVIVREGGKEDIDAFYSLLAGTGNRDGFKISQKSHYARFLSDLSQSFLLLATLENKPIAGLIGVSWNGTGIYYYGASSYEHRQVMAPYLLQWEAMQYCKRHGCTRYDLLGITPEGAGKDDPWQGISDFKRKFGGTVLTYPPERQIILRPVMKAALDLKRKILG